MRLGQATLRESAVLNCTYFGTPMRTEWICGIETTLREAE